MFKYIIAALAIYFVFFSSEDKPQAVSFPNSTIQKLYGETMFLMKFDKDIVAPRFVPMTSAQLKEEYCGNGDCSVSAIYYKGTIFYDNNLDLKSTLDRSIIVHELVHHIQNSLQGPTYDCDTWFKKEREAYKIEAVYLKMHGHSVKVVDEALKGLKCPT